MSGDTWRAIFHKVEGTLGYFGNKDAPYAKPFDVSGQCIDAMRAAEPGCWAEITLDKSSKPWRVVAFEAGQMGRDADNGGSRPTASAGGSPPSPSAAGRDPSPQAVGLVKSLIESGQVTTILEALEATRVAYCELRRWQGGDVTPLPHAQPRGIPRTSDVLRPPTADEEAKQDKDIPF